MDKIYLEGVTKFDELVESQRLIYSHEDKRESDEILCSIHTQWGFNYYAVKLSKKVREIYDSMQSIVYDPHITMNLSYYRCGEWVDKALATLEYNKIIGDRWLAWIDLNSLGIRPIHKLKNEENKDDMELMEEVFKVVDESQKILERIHGGPFTEEELAANRYVKPKVRKVKDYNKDKNTISGNDVVASNNVIKILGEAIVEGNVIKLNSGQLDRKDYADVNKVLETMGGKWNKKQGGHAFKNDYTDILNQVLETGSITDKKKETQFYATPEGIVNEMIQMADIKDGMSVLEPSAGDGAIVDRMPEGCKIKAVEYDKERYEQLKSKGTDVDCEDFIKWAGTCEERFDRIVMNPPFAKSQDVSHVTTAYGLLADGGKLVSIMSPGFTFKSDKKSVEFRELVESKGGYKENDGSAFKESGTMVKTVMAWLNK